MIYSTLVILVVPMGAGNPYATYAKCIKKDDKWATFMKKFEINEKEAKKFFKVFKRMDKKNKGTSRR